MISAPTLSSFGAFTADAEVRGFSRWKAFPIVCESHGEQNCPLVRCLGHGHCRLSCYASRSARRKATRSSASFQPHTRRLHHHRIMVGGVCDQAGFVRSGTVRWHRVTILAAVCPYFVVPYDVCRQHDRIGCLQFVYGTHPASARHRHGGDGRWRLSPSSTRALVGMDVFRHDDNGLPGLPHVVRLVSVFVKEWAHHRRCHHDEELPRCRRGIWPHRSHSHVKVRCRFFSRAPH